MCIDLHTAIDSEDRLRTEPYDKIRLFQFLHYM